jgi:hypothetical protein
MSSQTIGFFSCVLKRAFIPLSSDNDELPIDNLNALQSAIDALAKRDASDYTRQGELLGQGKAWLNEESGDETGPEAEGSLQIDDDFAMDQLGDGYGGRYW